MDEDGCESIQPTNYYVYISTDPVWNTIGEETACTGEAVDLSIEIEGVSLLWSQVQTSGKPFLCRTKSGVVFKRNQHQLFLAWCPLVGRGGWHREFLVNMEHSFLGDLDISFICPNGQSMQ